MVDVPQLPLRIQNVSIMSTFYLLINGGNILRVYLLSS